MLTDVAAERAVLAGIFQGGEEVYLDVSDIVSDGSFTEANGKIYAIMSYLIKSGTTQLDLASIMSTANTLGVKLDKTELDYINALKNFPINNVNVPKLAKKVAKLEIARMLKKQLKLIDNRLSDVTGEETADQIIGIAEKQIIDFACMLGDNQKTQQISEGIEDFFAFLQENPNRSIGIPTGYKEYDKAIGGGVRLGTVNLIGARPKQGKSLLTINMGVNIAKQKIPVLILDTEMCKEEQWPRIIASLSGVDIDKIEAGKMFKNEVDCQKVEKATQLLKSIPLHYRVIKGLQFEEILSIIRRWIVKEVGLVNGKANPCIVIYDYFKMMNTADLKDLNEHQAVGFQISQLSDMMGQYGAGCVAFTQLNREGIDREDLAAFSQSDRLGWICTSICIFKPKGEGENDQYNRKLIVVESRHGRGLDDGDYINMNVVGHLGRVTEGPTRNAVSKPKESGSSTAF